jgi:protocatechuate 3,4-dioxygenase alpha subunit
MTPSQTIGPFFTHALPYLEGPLVVPVSQHHSFWVRGKVLDGAAAPVPDALIESWQVTDEFSGFGRCPTDEQGSWALHTVKAPYLVLSIFARGLLNRVVTRVYFPDQEQLNATDPVLAALGEAARSTLIARPSDDGYTFDIHLQGEHETTFFAL